MRALLETFEDILIGGIVLVVAVVFSVFAFAFVFVSIFLLLPLTSLSPPCLLSRVRK